MISSPKKLIIGVGNTILRLFVFPSLEGRVTKIITTLSPTLPHQLGGGKLL